MMRILMHVLLLCATAVLASCSPQVAAQPAGGEKPAKEEGDLVAPRHFDGVVIPTKATELRAPQNFFSVRGWTSSSSWIKLSDLPADGAEVKEGDVVGKFDFRGVRALPQIKEHIDRRRANLEKSKIDLRQELRKLENDLKRVEIDVAQTAVDLEKAGAIAERTLAIYKMNHEVAVFERDALKKRIAVQRRRMAAEIAYLEKELERAEADMKRFHGYKTRFEVRAPHDGVLRHSYHRRRGRKIQKGDGMPSGLEFALLARDRSVSAEFFVPERRLREVEVGARVVVVNPANGESFDAAVTSIDRFPQEIGFLRQNDELANAREKAFVVRAEFVEQPEKLNAGSELKVSLR